MASESDVDRRRSRTSDHPLAIDAGTQALASFTSMQSPLSELPAEAYRNLLVVSTKSPAHVEQRLEEMGVPVGNVGLIPLDGSDYRYDGPLWTTDVVRPNDPTGLSIAVTNALGHLVSGTGWFLVEALNVLSMYVDEKTVCRLLAHLSRQARNRDVRGVYGVVRSAVSDDTYGNYRQSVDAAVDVTDR